ncbi:hypothetical protein GCM10025787_03370 [Saccharopolyspora rosea]|uniref:Uncharacterized protein n=1 Tax=Saccharopolyspora rosea TaxID=524884 RepID=A0ABW3FNX5_9PSEU
MHTETGTPPAAVALWMQISSYEEPARVVTVAERTRTPGLVIIPGLQRSPSSRWEFDGGWDLVHERSGQTLVSSTLNGAGLGHMRDAAALLGAHPRIDWTAPAESLHDTHWLVAKVENDVEKAVRQARPLRLWNSWEVTPPPWQVVRPQPDGNVDIVVELDSHQGAVGFLDLYGSDDMQLRRSPVQEWELHCAWIDCRRPCLLEHGRCSSDRADLTAEANVENWRWLNDHRVLCPSCSHLFTPSRPPLDL